MEKKVYTHVIWDFNGTILDDIDLGIVSVNRMLEERGLPVIPDRAYYREIMRFPIRDYYAELGFDFEKEDYYQVLAPEWVGYYLAGEGSCGLMPGVVETLEAIRQKGLRQLVLSASDLPQLRGQLSRLGVDGYFDEVLGLDNIYAADKTALARAWRERNPQAVPLFIGDTDHDDLAAEAMGADCVLYTGGHQSEKRLSTCGKPLIKQVTELLTLL